MFMTNSARTSGDLLAVASYCNRVIRIGTCYKFPSNSNVSHPIILHRFVLQVLTASQVIVLVFAFFLTWKDIAQFVESF